VHEISLMTIEDIGFAAEQTVREGWASGRDDFVAYLEHEPGGCFVAREGGRRIGMVTTTRHGVSGWIANLIVVPEARSRGVGRALMERGLAYLEEAGVATVRLDGDPPGIPLYRSLGFVDEWESLRFRWQGREAPASTAVERITSADLDKILTFDAPRFGDDRSKWLRLFRGSGCQGFKVGRHGELAGYLMMVRTDIALRIGPCVAVDAGAARALVAAALDAGEIATVGLPESNHEARALYEDLGFRQTASSLRMVRGPMTASGDLNQVYAIANGAVG
jgi:ribosomal protein S18 acetylase RimI-like enzyme